MSTRAKRFPTPDPFYLDKDTKLWPRRLLHVSSMTSFERQGEACYNGVERPLYNILSYTWGRYEIPSGPALPVQNLTWRVPSINPERFTVDDFRNTLLAASEGVEYVWVDIACIDQENWDVKMDEIGKQAGIFQNAKEAYIWLHGATISTLQRLCDSLLALAARLDGEQTKVVHFNSEHQTTIHWDENDIDSDIMVGEKTYLPECLSDSTWIQSLSETLQDLTADVWFSSLWTLQEAFLRPEALVLSREGVKVQREGFGEISLALILMTMGEIELYAGKARRLSKRSEAARASLTALVQVERTIEKIGLGAWNNPNVLYHSAKFRQTRGGPDDVDRVYGIMQVFGLRLGEAAKPGRQFTLLELETEFAIEMMALSPIWAQLFSHKEPAPLGSCWRITQHSHMPQALTFVSARPASTCSIRMEEDMRPVFRGMRCLFPTLVLIWRRMAIPLPWTIWGVERAVQVVALDETEFSRLQIPEDLRHIDTENFETNDRLCQVLVDKLGEELDVLLLGQLLDEEEFDDEDLKEDEDIEQDLNESVSIAEQDNFNKGIPEDSGHSQDEKQGSEVTPVDNEDADSLEERPRKKKRHEEESNVIDDDDRDDEREIFDQLDSSTKLDEAILRRHKSYHGVVGILARKITFEKRTAWQRVGVCVWMEIPTALIAEERLWSRAVCPLV